MAYTSGYEYDVFVSYARKDDEQEWITEIVRQLGSDVSSRLGRAGDSLRFFFDVASLKGNDDLERLKAAARSTAVFLAIGSPSYVDSDWCSREREAFQERDKSGKRLFVIEMLPLKADKKYDARIQDQNRIAFWEVAKLFSDAPTVLSASATRYDMLLQKVAAQIATVLEELKAVVNAGAGIGTELKPSVSARRAKGVVFLGQTTDDLEDDRLDVRNYLEQYGYLVLPESDLPGGGPDFRRAVADIFSTELVKIYVQILGPRPGRKPADLPEGYPRAQIDAAREAGVVTRMWRRPDIDISAIADKDHQSLMNDEDVVSSTIADFKEAIRKELERKPKVDDDEGEEATERQSIFINSETSDMDVAKNLQKQLGERDMTVRLSLFYGDTKEKRQRLYECMQEYDFILLIYGRASPEWVQSQLDLFMKLNPRVKRKHMKVLATLDGPPDGKPDDLGVSMPELRWIECRDGWKVDPVLKLIEEVG